MWLTSAALSAASRLAIIVLVIVRSLQADYAEGLHADATATDGGLGAGGVPSNTGLLIGAALIAVALLAVLIARVTGPPHSHRRPVTVGVLAGRVSVVHWFGSSVGEPRDRYDGPVTRSGWLFLALVALWALLVVFDVMAIVENLRNDKPFDFTFWLSAVIVAGLAGDLVRAGQLRWSRRH